jgi:hypothetical protein
VSVVYSTSDGTACEGQDYVPVGHQVLTIPALDSTGSITVRVKGDRQVEPNETFRVTLKNPVHATIGDGRGVGTIVNDDAH